MRDKWTTALRILIGAYPGAVGWVLAGCGWGVVAGAVLEASFGRGTDGLLGAAGETSLEATAGALLGMVAWTVGMTLLHGITLVPVFVLMGWVGGRFARGDSSRGVMHERSARMGVVTAVACAVVNGTWGAPLLGAGALLESIHGQPVPCDFVQGGTLAGILAGGILALVELGRTCWRQLSEEWRAEVRRGMRPVSGS
jgi:hypothetical protein